MMKPKPTISSIAEAAGVSRTSVSFAFNYPDRLATDTLERILAISDQLGYSPDPIARSMNTGRIGSIGLLLPQSLGSMMHNPFIAEFIEGVAEVTEPKELPLMLVSPQRGSMEHAVRGTATDGFLTLGLETFRDTVRVLEDRHLPYVMVDSEPVDGVNCVNADDVGGSDAAMSHVLSLGHRAIGILGIRSGHHGRWDKYVGTLARRIEGYQLALARHGLTLDDVQFTECDVSGDGGRAGFAELQRQDDQLTAIVAMSDVVAIGAIEEAHHRGLQVPADISIIGFDDLPEARWSQPPLTTIQQPSREKGRIAARKLVARLEGDKDTEHVALDTKLIVRESTAKATSQGS